MVDGIHIRVSTDVLRDFYDGMAKDAECAAKVAEGMLAAFVEKGGDNQHMQNALIKSIGDTRAVQATARAEAWRFLRENTPPGLTMTVKPQELLDLGIRLAKG